MKLIQNYIYNLIYQVFLVLVPLVTVPYISRVLGSYGVGVNAYTNSIVSYFILLGSLGVLTYGNRTIAYVREDAKKLTLVFWEISLLRFLTVGLTSVVYILFIFNAADYRLAFLSQFPLLIASAFDISWFFMGLEDFKKTVVRNILVKFLTLLLIFIFVKDIEDTNLYIVILSMSQLLGNIILWPYLKQYLVKVKFKDLQIGQHFLPTLRLFIPQIAIQVYVVVNKTMLGAYSGVDATGFFDNADKIVKVMLSVVTASGTVMLPRMANEYTRGRHENMVKYLIPSFNFSSLISFPMTFGLIAISRQFSAFFFGLDFAGIDGIINILAFIIIAISWSNVIGIQYLLPTNQMRGYTGSVIIGALSNIILNFILIPSYAAMGAALGSVLSELIVTFLQVFYIRKTIKISQLFGESWKYLLASLLMWLMVWATGAMLDGMSGLIIQIALGVIVYGLAISLLRPQIMDLIIKQGMKVIRRR